MTLLRRANIDYTGEPLETAGDGIAVDAERLGNLIYGEIVFERFRGGWLNGHTSSCLKINRRLTQRWLTVAHVDFALAGSGNAASNTGSSQVPSLIDEPRLCISWVTMPQNALSAEPY